MDKLSLDTLAVRVVAWHNRHPLARRIGVQHVLSIGYVALPYRVTGAEVAPAPVAADEQPAGASLRERAMARARQPAAAPAAPAPSATPVERPIEPAFSEDFLAPIRASRVASWAAQHGRELTPEPADGPVRRIDWAGASATRTLYAMTALIEAAGLRSRVLVGPGEQPAVLGRRLWNRPRLVGLAALPLAIGGLVLLLQNLAGGRAQSTLDVAPRAAASAAPPASAAPAAPSAAEASATLPPPKSVVAPAPVADASTRPAMPSPDAPLDVAPTIGRIALPPLALPQGDAARKAVRAERLARAGSAASTAAAEPVVAKAAAAAASKPVSASAPAPPPAAAKPETAAATAVASAPGRPVFAVSTRILRTRGESEQVMVAMQALLASTGARGVQVQIVPSGADWRVVGWPFPKRDEAERARALLASRGMRVEVVDF